MCFFMNKGKLLIILGNLTAFGPFVTDFYLPCLPKMTRYFVVTPSIVQVSLTTGMVGLALGQILIGPITDKYGRKKILLGSLMLFALATIVCMFSKDISLFITFRLFQGLTGASALVISKAIVSDMFTGDEMKKFFSSLAAVQGVAPILAPILGGLAFTVGGTWRAPFALLSLWSLWLFFDCLRLKESLQKEKRITLPIYKSFECYGEIFKNPPYMVMNFIFGFASAALMAYISSSPFIFQEHFSLSPLQYSICFACNAIALVLGSIVILRIRRLPLALEMSILLLTCSCVFTFLALVFNLPFGVFEFVLFMLLFGIGMITPVAMTIALNVVKTNRGTAAGLIGASPYILGGVVAPLTGLGNIIYPTAIIIFLSALICFVLYLVYRRFNITLD